MLQNEIRKTSEEYWNTIYTNKGNSNIEVDDWLKQFDDIIDMCEYPVLDLGCGRGNDTMYFLQKGKDVSVCDQSTVAIDTIKKNFLMVDEAKCFNMLDGIDFPDYSFGIVCADLCLHYFTEDDTAKILREIRRVLVPGGHVLVRVNSINDTNFGAGQGEEVEHHLYKKEDGMLKRFFDEDDIEEIFAGFEILSCEEQKLHRFHAEKVLYCICLRG